MSESTRLGRDLTGLASLGLLDAVVGRENEIDQILRVLCRRTKSNALLLGEPGVGKTALVEGVAQLLSSRAVPPALRGRRLLELEIGSLLAGTQFRGDLEKRLQEFLSQAREERSIVFIDEIHLLSVAGRGSGVDVANLLKPILARGEVPCIGATTPDEAREMFRLDPALERRFQPVVVKEPEPAAVRLMLCASRIRLEAHHGLLIEDAAIDAAVKESLVGQGRRNPDRALDLLEDACAREQLRLSRELEATAAESVEQIEWHRELAAAADSLDVFRHVRAREAIGLGANLLCESALASRILRPRITAHHIALITPG